MIAPSLVSSPTGYQGPIIPQLESEENLRQNLRDSLNRLTSTTIVATNCFYDNLAKSRVSEAFHLFDRYKLYQERKGRAASPHLSFVEMSEFFYHSVAVANYIKQTPLPVPG
jgi:Replication initiator protein A